MGVSFGVRPSVTLTIAILPFAGRPFFFQAEDGIRAPLVTGVQTCALPIWDARDRRAGPARRIVGRAALLDEETGVAARSEERRVGKESRSKRPTNHQKKHNNNTSGQYTVVNAPLSCHGLRGDFNSCHRRFA